MNKFFPLFDKWVSSILANLVGLSMALLTAIVFIQVIARYVLKVSTGGIGELPSFLMIFAVWLAAAMNARKHDGHIKLELLNLFIKNKKVLKSVELITNLLTVMSIAVFTYLSFEYVEFGIESGDVSAGMQMPMWWLSAVVPISGVLMTIYFLSNVYRSIKEIRKC